MFLGSLWTICYSYADSVSDFIDSSCLVPTSNAYEPYSCAEGSEMLNFLLGEFSWLCMTSLSTCSVLSCYVPKKIEGFLGHKIQRCPFCAMFIRPTFPFYYCLSLNETIKQIPIKQFSLKGVRCFLETLPVCYINTWTNCLAINLVYMSKSISVLSTMQLFW